MPDNSEDWTSLRGELLGIRQRRCEIAAEATMHRNEPEIFVRRFWRDFYHALLSNAARNAMQELLVLVLGFLFIGMGHAQAEDRLNMVIAVDLTQSVAIAGPDGKTDFQKNIDGVTLVLSQVSAGTRITVIGITDHSFAQPYMLLSARVPDDPGHFGERLNAARGQIIRAWKVRNAHLDPHFPRTDTLGALQLAGQIFAQQADGSRKTLVIFSDMRHSMSDLDMEAPSTVPPFSIFAKRCGPLADLHNVQVLVLGVDGSGKSAVYWQSLKMFWEGYFHNAGAIMRIYSILRELQTSADLR
jgi:hypothetical protein